MSDAPSEALAENILKSRKRVAFSDCDPFGMLYNTRYLDYVLDARDDHMLDRFGVDILKPMRSGAPVIVGHQVSYFEPARAHEEVLVSTCTLDLTPTSLILEGVITSGDERRIKYHQWTSLRMLDLKSGRASELTDDDFQAFQRTLASTGADPADYPARVKALRRRYSR